MKSKTKKYPRATLRRIVKAHSRKNIGKGVDSLVFLNYILFIEEYANALIIWRLQLTQYSLRLMQNATNKARADGEKMIAAKDIRKVTMV